jgi:mannosyltransferase OCH1-like enzyme
MKFWIKVSLGLLSLVILILLTILLVIQHTNKTESKKILREIMTEIDIIKHNNKSSQNKLKIPRKIIQTIPDKNSISPEFQANIDYIKKTNPNWDYKLYDNSDCQKYIEKNYPEYLQYYLAINPKYGAARADLFRYLIMYKEGGAYFDIKSAMEYPLDKVIYPLDEYILSHWGNNVGWPHQGILKKYGEFQQWHIICMEKHPALKAVIDKVIENIQTYDVNKTGVGKSGVLKVTGPIPYTRAILPLMYKYNFRILKSNVDLGLIYNNLEINHKKVFGKSHYSNCRENIILDVEMLKQSQSKEKENKSVELSLVPNCASVLEIRNGKLTLYINDQVKVPSIHHVVIDPDREEGNGYRVINKNILNLTTEDIVKFRPIRCVILYCSDCLKDLLNTDIGMQILSETHNIVDKTNNTTTQRILHNMDFVISDQGYGYNSDIMFNIYSRVIIPKPRENFNLQWEKELIKTGGHPNKPINKQIQRENLILLRDFLERHGIRYILDCGTLLGLIRDNDLITHDLDSDITVDKKDINVVRRHIEELRNMDFIPWRNSENTGWMSLSLTRKGEYTDLYSWDISKIELGKYLWNGEAFNIPAYPEEWLEEMYGPNWKTPTEDKSSYDDKAWEKGMPQYMKKHAKS